MISLIINADTRPGSSEDSSQIGDRGNEFLAGCRNSDFLTDGVINKMKFFRDHPIETVVCVDEHEPVAGELAERLAQMLLATTDSLRYVIKPHARSDRHWNDRLYLEALREATGEYVVHFDGDAAAFRRDGCPIIDQYIEWLDSGRYKFICQATALTKEQHGMWWASTRFFITKREHLNLDELERCLDPSYRRAKYGTKHTPCLEHIIGLIAGDDSVHYPPIDLDNYAIFSWVHYYRGLLGRLNALSYDEVRDYVVTRCGGIHGASDFVPLLPLP